MNTIRSLYIDPFITAPPCVHIQYKYLFTAPNRCIDCVHCFIIAVSSSSNWATWFDLFARFAILFLGVFFYLVKLKSYVMRFIGFSGTLKKKWTTLMFTLAHNIVKSNYIPYRQWFGITKLHWKLLEYRSRLSSFLHHVIYIFPVTSFFIVFTIVWFCLLLIQQLLIYFKPIKRRMGIFTHVHMYVK